MYRKAPLPFVGQKRQFINHFIKTLTDNISNQGDDYTIVDAFGGSGLLAHVANHTLPKARVIYNDFDNYAQRLQHIDDTNRLRELIFSLTQQYPRNAKTTPQTKEIILQAIADFNGFVDFKTLSSWVLFSGNYANNIEELAKLTFYNCVRTQPYPSAEGYLDELEITHSDFEALIKQHHANPRALLVLDPPYVSTMQGMYSNKNYFGMVEFLRLMNHVRPPFIFFSSTRSELLTYLDFVVRYKTQNWQNLANTQKISLKTSVNYNSSYEDNLVYKF